MLTNSICELSSAMLWKYSYKLGLNWQTDHWRIHVSANGQDAFFFSDRHEVRSNRRNLLNISAAYLMGQYRLSLWGRNLTNQDYTVRGFGSFGNDPRNGYGIKGSYVQFGEPRTMGFTLEYRTGD